MAHPYQQECGAKTRSGEPCKAPAMSNGRCRIHGGKSLAGPANGNYRTGAWSKLLPVRLAARQQISAKDPKLLELTAEISLVDSLITELMEERDKKISRKWLEELSQCVADVIENRYDYQAQGPHLNRLKRLVRERARRYEIQDELGRMIDRRARLAESERKRKIQDKQMISVDQLNILLGHVIQIISQEVKDRSVLSRISTGISKVIDVEPEKKEEEEKLISA